MRLFEDHRLSIKNINIIIKNATNAINSIYGDISASIIVVSEKSWPDIIYIIILVF